MYVLMYHAFRPQLIANTNARATSVATHCVGILEDEDRDVYVDSQGYIRAERVTAETGLRVPVQIARALPGGLSVLSPA